MLHFTCDLCGQQLSDQRFVAKLEVYPAFDPEQISEEDLDSDHLQEIAELIEHMELTGEKQVDDCSTQNFRFDLCPTCQQKYVKDPLAKHALNRMNFSEN